MLESFELQQPWQRNGEETYSGTVFIQEGFIRKSNLFERPFKCCLTENWLRWMRNNWVF